MTGGFSLGLYELFASGGGAAGFLAIFVLPFVIMIHGPHMVMPKIILVNKLKGENDTKWKYVFGILFPAVGVALGLAITYALALLLGIKI